MDVQGNLVKIYKQSSNRRAEFTPGSIRSKGSRGWMISKDGDWSMSLPDGKVMECASYHHPDIPYTSGTPVPPEVPKAEFVEFPVGPVPRVRGQICGCVFVGGHYYESVFYPQKNGWSFPEVFRNGIKMDFGVGVWPVAVVEGERFSYVLFNDIRLGLLDIRHMR